MPGGKKEGGESPLQTAGRELEGETNIRIDNLPRLQYIDREWRELPREHWKCYFQVDITETERDWMSNHHPGNEGEDPKFFTPGELQNAIARGEILEPHLKVMGRYKLLERRR